MHSAPLRGAKRSASSPPSSSPSCHYVTVKLGQQISVDALLRRIDASPALRLDGFTRQHLMAFGRLADLPEMHDRLIGAAAVVHDAPIVTRDQLLRDRPFIRVVW